MDSFFITRTDVRCYNRHIITVFALIATRFHGEIGSEKCSQDCVSLWRDDGRVENSWDWFIMSRVWSWAGKTWQVCTQFAQLIRIPGNDETIYLFSITQTQSRPTVKSQLNFHVAHVTYFIRRRMETRIYSGSLELNRLRVALKERGVKCFDFCTWRSFMESESVKLI